MMRNRVCLVCLSILLVIMAACTLPAVNTVAVPATAEPTPSVVQPTVAPVFTTVSPAPSPTVTPSPTPYVYESTQRIENVHVVQTTETKGDRVFSLQMPRTGKFLIDDVLETQVAPWRALWESDTLQSMTVQVTVANYDLNTQGFLFTAVSRAIGAEDIIVEQTSATFDLSTGKLCDWRDFFTDRYAAETQIMELLMESIEAPDVEKYSEFLLFPDRLSFFTPQGELSIPVEPLVDIMFPRVVPATPEPVATPLPTYCPVTPAPMPPLPPPDGPVVALTFDDGPHRIETPRLLDALAAYHAHGTFFLIGRNAVDRLDIVARIAAEGHSIGSHTYDHKNLTKLDGQGMIDQLETTAAIIEFAGAPRPWLLRPPFGAVDDNVKYVSGMPIVMWNIDPLDWKVLDAQIVAEHILQRVKPGDIILLHDIYPTSVDAAILVMDALSQQGYRFVTVEEMLAMAGKSAEASKVYHRVNVPIVLSEIEQ